MQPRLKLRHAPPVCRPRTILPRSSCWRLNVSTGETPRTLANIWTTWPCRLLEHDHRRDGSRPSRSSDAGSAASQLALVRVVLDTNILLRANPKVTPQGLARDLLPTVRLRPPCADPLVGHRRRGSACAGLPQ